MTLNQYAEENRKLKRQIEEMQLEISILYRSVGQFANQKNSRVSSLIRKGSISKAERQNDISSLVALIQNQAEAA